MTATRLIGEVRVVDDVPLAFADLASVAILDSAGPRFVLGCSGGSSGVACAAELAKRDLPWSRIEVVFADERCVASDSAEYNGRAIAVALGPRVDEVAGYHQMSCGEGPEPYAALLKSLGRIDLLQLGFGPDGHTASIFADSPELLAPSDTVVARNADPTGANPHDRLTLTAMGLRLAVATVVTVIGANKAGAFSALTQGGSLPAALADRSGTTWLVDRSVVASR